VSGKGKKKGKRPGRGRQAPERVGSKPPASGLHFTIGTGSSFDEATQQLTLKNDARLLKAGLLYADRVKLASAGSSITLRMVDDAKLCPDAQLDFLERHFRENLSRDSPEEAAVGIEFVRRYRELRQGRNVAKDLLPKRLEYARELAEIWARFQKGWEGFARTTGIEEIQAARRSGFVDVATFAAGGLERGAALTPDANALRSEEYWEAITAELFGMLSDAVNGGKTHPMLDDQAGELVRLGIEAEAIPVSETGRARGRHGGLASDLLRRLPLFDDASVDEILDARRALEIPLVKFRSEVSKYSDGMRAQGWEPEFAANAEDVFVREVAPAVQEIEEMVRDDRFLAALWPRMSRPQDWAAGGTFGMLAFNLASLPEITSLAVGGTVGLAATARNTYLEHRDAQRAIEGHRLFFYREAGRRLAGS
jgi:hypothetical protein